MLYALPNFGIKAISFLLLPLYTRFLSPADYGIISIAETIAVVAAILGGLGLAAGMTRLYFQHVERPEELRRYVSSVVRFGAGTLAATVVLAMLVGPAVGAAMPRLSLPFFPYVALAAVTAALLSLIEFRLALLQVERQPERYAAFALASFGLTTLCAIVFVVVLRWGALGMLVGKLLAVGCSALAALFLLRNWLAGGFEYPYVRETLRLSVPLVPHSLMAAGLVAADRFILQHYRDLGEVGIYSLAYAMGMVMFLVTNSLSQAWSPIYFDVARGGEAAAATLGRVSTALCLLLTAVALFGAAIAQDFVAWFLDPRFAAAGRLVPWIIAGYLFHSYFVIFHLAALQGKRSEFLLLASSIALVANLALNFVLVPRWGMYGAAWATAAAYALEAAVMYSYGQRVHPLRYRARALVLAIAVLLGGVAATQAAFDPAHRPFWMLAVVLIGWTLLGLLGGRDVARTANLMWSKLTK